MKVIQRPVVVANDRMTLLICLLALAAGCVDKPGADGAGGDSIRVELGRAGDGLRFCDDRGRCQTAPNPDDCERLVIETDIHPDGTSSCTTCYDADGGVKSRLCDGADVVCQPFTAPEPDCVVCAFRGSVVFFSTCQPVAPSDDAAADAATRADGPVVRADAGIVPKKNQVGDRIEAESGQLSGAFTVVGGAIVYRGTGGEPARASYRVSVAKEGDYVIRAQVKAQDNGSDSLLVDIDGEPKDPAGIWDVAPLTEGFEQRLVNGRGTGAFDRPEFAPKRFHLAAGEHEIVVLRRETETYLDWLVLEAAPPQTTSCGDGRCSAGAESCSSCPKDCGVCSATSKLWRDFERDRNAGRPAVLPEFYAGYHYGARPIPDVKGRVFQATAYGVKANDGKSDQAALQSAINAATRYTKDNPKDRAVVVLPAGRLMINADSDPLGTKPALTIDGSRVVLRGAGGGDSGGTELFSLNKLEPRVPDAIYTTPPMLYVSSPWNGGPIGTVTADAARGSKALKVSFSSSRGLRVGEWFWMRPTAGKHIQPHFVHPNVQLVSSRKYNGKTCTNGTDKHNNTLMTYGARYRVARVSGATVELEAPLQMAVRAAQKWEVRRYSPNEEVGVEDIRFRGNWVRDGSKCPSQTQGCRFRHHRSADDDGGWTAVKVQGNVHSWIRRCSFVNWNRKVQLVYTAQFSLVDVRMSGNGGHSSAGSGGGHGTLLVGVDVASPDLHGPGVSWGDHGSVVLYSRFRNGPGVDAHAGTVYATLLDNVELSPSMRSSGGATATKPDHIGKLVYWNTINPRELKQHDWWNAFSGCSYVNRAYRPILVGLTGATATFNNSALPSKGGATPTRLEALESNGKRVVPESLYVAQLARRIGSAPAWIEALARRWRQTALQQ